MTLGRLVRSMHAITVDLPREQVRQVSVPNQVGLFGQLNPFGFLRGVWRIEETKLDFVAILRVNREIRSAAVPGGAQRIGSSRPHPKPVHGTPRKSQVYCPKDTKNASRGPHTLASCNRLLCIVRTGGGRVKSRDWDKRKALTSSSR